MIDLDPFRKLCYHSTFETRSFNFLDPMEKFFGTDSVNPVHIETSNVHENWHGSTKISDVKLTSNLPFVRRISFGVILKLRGVIKLFSDYSCFTWERVNCILPRPLTNITKGPEYAGTRNFADSVQTEMNFCHCFSRYCLNDRVVASST